MHYFFCLEIGQKFDDQFIETIKFYKNLFNTYIESDGVIFIIINRMTDKHYKSSDNIINEYKDNFFKKCNLKINFIYLIDCCYYDMYNNENVIEHMLEKEPNKLEDTVCISSYLKRKFILKIIPTFKPIYIKELIVPLTRRLEDKKKQHH